MSESAFDHFTIDDAAIPFDDGNGSPTESPSEPHTNASTDPVCRVCGIGLTYSGRGRRPTLCDEHKKAARPPGSSSRRSSGDVAAAVAILSSLYDVTALGLMAVSPSAAHKWSRSVPGLLETDAVILAADKDLCHQILRMGEANGKTVFYMAHLMAVIPVVIEIRSDFADRRANRREREAEIPDDASSLSSQDGFPNERFFG